MSTHDSTLARLLQELTPLASEELERALADSTALFARLRAQAESLGQGFGPAAAAFSTERAHRELSMLILRELVRLCELAAAPDRPDGLARGDLSDLLEEELACAESLEVAPPALISGLRSLATGLPHAESLHAVFADCARSLRELSR